jgi:hypothetical protein
MAFFIVTVVKPLNLTDELKTSICKEDDKAIAECSLTTQSELYHFTAFQLHTPLKLKDLRNENGELWRG